MPVEWKLYVQGFANIRHISRKKKTSDKLDASSRWNFAVLVYCKWQPENIELISCRPGPSSSSVTTSEQTRRAENLSSSYPLRHLPLC